MTSPFRQELDIAAAARTTAFVGHLEARRG